ncbi:ABC transporter permease subunit [Candidatus Micrarchaeota archaeon]|nr:ABC transporter permease subunit [Candidatus Micrarchaeota archaeon]
MRAWIFALLLAIIAGSAFLLMGADALLLPYYALRSFLRMGAAYIISIVFSFAFGILILHSKKAYELVFPVLDVLQAVPILGFFPFAIIFFVATFPGGIIGQELASIFLIFTSMTWSIIFAVVESGASLTSEIRDLARMTGLKGFRYLTHVVLPTTFPQFVSGSIAGWGGGWYFLVAAEYLALGHERIALPGLGMFIATSAFSFHILNAILGIATLTLVVVGMNIFFWQPLLRKAKNYTLQPVTGEEKKENSLLDDVLDSAYAKLCAIFERMQKSTENLLEYLSISPKYSTSFEKTSSVMPYMMTLFVLFVFLFFLFVKAPYLLEDYKIVVFAVSSIMRIFIAFVIALTWTSLVALFLARNKKAMSVLMPLFDLGQSIPAVSLFPVLVVLVVNSIGGWVGLEIASVLLVITGMQWYLLFNLIRAVQTVPDDLMDISKLLRLGTFNRLKQIMIPAILPAVFVGGLEAIGGGWNASIISEFIIGSDGQPYLMNGLGNLLSISTYAGNMDGVIVAVSGITLLVLLTNMFFWKPLIKESYKYKL